MQEPAVEPAAGEEAKAPEETKDEVDDQEVHTHRRLKKIID